MMTTAAAAPDPQQPAGPAVRRLSDSQLQQGRREFDSNGFCILRNVLPAAPLAQLHQALAQEFDRVVASGELFSGGGLVSGHLNCFPGAGARAVYEGLQQAGVMDLVKQLRPQQLRMPNVGCNFNLPGSHTQHWHTDRPFAREFPVVNVTLVDTSAANGATDIIPGTHRELIRYTRFVFGRVARNARRVETRRGDVVIRSSSTWHRGMTNHTATPRPMLAFTWEDGGSPLDDPFAIHGGQIRFLPNWFRLTPLGRLRERAFVKMPAVYAALRLARSLVDHEY
jgi:ectoine hydroxylase-related dioxygenase (phytanoyl-CoA dioxygenase family)